MTHASSFGVTVTAVQPPGRYGRLTVGIEHEAQFEEKPRGDGGWVNGGYFVADYDGLSQRSLGLAVSMGIFLLSLAGIPFFAGWAAKFFVMLIIAAFVGP